jgi:hypothetical protein
MSQGFAGNFAGGGAGYGQSGVGLLNKGTLGGLPQLSPYEQWKQQAMSGMPQAMGGGDQGDWYTSLSNKTNTWDWN